MTENAHPELCSDLDETSIALLVRTFYGRAREDDLIGPVFNEAVKDWDHHITQISDFWSSIMLRTGRYHGRPMAPHMVLPIKGEHFDRWLSIFDRTTHDLFEPEIAKGFMLRARRIADSFEMGLASIRGEMTTPRHSLGEPLTPITRTQS